VGNEPNHPPISKNVTIKNAATDAAQESVVRVIGEGCNGAVQGSGFVVTPNVVITNAHVVAGIKEPYVYKGTKPHAAQTVYFDQDYDIAILRTKDMDDIKPLQLSQVILADKSPVLIMGHPDNGALTISGGSIIDSINARGRNIYDRGLVTRQIYEVSASIEQGNSGGPMIAADGTVAGLVFGKSVTNKSVSYVLPSSRLSTPLAQFADSTTKVSTSKCVY
jgi:S1-C subfamily serine protease